MNAIIIVEEKVSDFPPLFSPWKAMLRALVQESHLNLKGIGTPRFDWGTYSFCDNEDRHALFDCKVLRAQVQSLVKSSIIWVEREIMRKGDCMVASLCPLATQLETSCKVISVGSRKDWDEYLLKRLGKATSASLSSIVIEEIIESPADPGSLNPGKGKSPPAIEGFTPLVLTLPVVVRLALSSV